MTYETVAEAIRRIAGEYPEGTKIVYVLTGLRNDPVGHFLEGELNFCCTMTSWGPALLCGHITDYLWLVITGQVMTFFDYTVSLIAGAYSGRRVIAT